jgi:hypothetical protein
MANDITILAVCVFILLGVSIFVPIIQSAYSSEFYSLNNNIEVAGDIIGQDTSKLSAAINEGGKSVSLTNYFTWANVLTSIFTTFILFWNPLLPFFVNVFLIWPIKFIIVAILARNIWVGGGG